MTSIPERYTRLFDYSAYQIVNPTRPLPGIRVNIDLNDLERVTDGLITALETIVLDQALDLSDELDFTGKTITGGTFVDAILSGTLDLTGTTATAGTFVDATFVNPTLGTASVTALNGLVITSTASTLTIAPGVTISFAATTTFTGGGTIALGAGGTVAYTANNLSVFAATTSAQLATLLSDETGTGPAVFANGPTLGSISVSAINGLAITSTASTLTIAASEVISFADSTAFTGGGTIALGAGGTVAYTANNLSVFAATTSAQLRTLLSDETGTGAAVFANDPVFGNITVNAVNGLSITGTSATLTMAASKAATFLNTLILSGIDGTTLTFQGSDTYVGRITTDTLANKTLTAPAINSGTLIGGTHTAITSLGIRSTGAGAFDLTLANVESLTAARTLTFSVNNAARTITLGGDLALAGTTSLPITAQGDIWYGSSAGTLLSLPKDTSAKRYLSNTGATNNPAWAQIDLTNGVTGILPVINGGTSASTLTGLLQGNGQSVVTTITNSTTVGQVLRVTGSNTYAWGALDLADADAITGDLPFANLTQGSALSVLGVTGNATADFASIAAASDYQVLRRSGTALAFGAVNLASSSAVTGVLPAANFATGTPTGSKFLRDDQVWTTPAGAGDFVGPASSTDNAVVRFDGTTGKLGQNSGVLIDDSSNLAPVTVDVGALGTSSLMWADLYLASGGEINFNSNNVKLTHSNNTLNMSAASFLLELNASSGDPILNFKRAGTSQSFIRDTGARIEVVNAAASAGVVMDHAASAWSALSDARLRKKQNARPVSVLDKIDDMRLVEYGEDYRELGFVAQKLYRAFPHVVNRGDDEDRVVEDYNDPGAWSIMYDRTGPIAIQLGKEIWQNVDPRIARLEQLVARLEAEVRRSP